MGLQSDRIKFIASGLRMVAVLVWRPSVSADARYDYCLCCPRHAATTILTSLETTSMASKSFDFDPLIRYHIIDV